MAKTIVVGLVITSLMLSSCAQQDGQSTTGQTIGEGAALGAVAGALGGALFGQDTKGILIGTAIGSLLGGVAGTYVAQQKKKYATIEQRIAGERQITAQATMTAQSQTAASAAKLRVANAELAEFSRMSGDRARAQEKASVILAGLQQQRSALEANRKDLATSLKNQQSFITETEQEIGAGDVQKRAQLAQWNADIPSMRAALSAMDAQIADVSAMETQVQRVRTSCC